MKERVSEKSKGCGRSGIADTLKKPTTSASRKTRTEEPTETAKAPETAEPRLKHELTRVGEPQKCKTKEQISKPITNPTILALLPKYKIECKRCGETVPCHYSWFERSTVLCPLCYHSMTDREIKKFHIEHNAQVPEQNETADSLPHIPDKVVNSIGGTCKRPTVCISASESWTVQTITSASEREILDGVRDGKISKARARIELRRRQNKEYFDMLASPERLGVKPIMF